MIAPFNVVKFGLQVAILAVLGMAMIHPIVVYERLETRLHEPAATIHAPVTILCIERLDLAFGET